MIKLKDELILYHGSFTEVSNIDLSKCTEGLDFGRGFYLTSSYEQAYNYVPNSVKKARRLNKVPSDFKIEDGKINVYRFHANPNILIHYFDEADADWLHFVTANRDATLFPKLIDKLKTTDIIAGKIADDNTARTLAFYVQGVYGVPGSTNADAVTLDLLLPNRLKDQFCFRTLDAVGTLEFIRSDRYGDK